MASNSRTHELRSKPSDSSVKASGPNRIHAAGCLAPFTLIECLVVIGMVSILASLALADEMEASPGQRFVLEGSMNLSNQIAWLAYTLTDTSTNWVDTAAAGHEHRFYRAMLLP